MLIAINGELIKTEYIWKIGPVKIVNYGFICFDIHLFNSKSVTVIHKPNIKIVNYDTVELDGVEIHYEDCSVLTDIIYESDFYKSEVKWFEGVRNDIIKLWDDNKSEIKSFNTRTVSHNEKV